MEEYIYSNILEEMKDSGKPFGTMPQEPWNPGKGNKPDCIIQHNYEEVRTHENCKTTRTWECFDNREAKLTFLL